MTKRGRIPAWAIVLIVVGGLGVVVVAPLTRVFAAWKLQEVRRRTECTSNMLGLLHAYVVDRAAHGVRPAGGRESSSRLHRRASFESGDEDMFLCPADPIAKAPTTPEQRAALDAIDFAHAPRGLCSYAFRAFDRFPVDPLSDERAVFAACIHHKGVAIVAFNDGDVVSMNLAELGLSTDDEKIVGPESKSPVLRWVRYADDDAR